MKKSFALFTAALWPAAAFAQAPVKAADAAAAAAPPIAAPAAAAVATFPAPILERVEFKDADLPAIIEYLKVKNDELGGDQRNLNIIVAPGLEKLQVPGLSLRNVTIADVLTITSNVLDVQLEPVISAASGENVAWIVKNKAPSTASGVTAPSTGFVPAGSGHPGGSGATATGTNASAGGGGAGFISSAPADTGTTSGSGIVGIGGGSGFGGGASGGGSGFGSGGAGVVELASTGAGGGAAPRTVTKVIGMTALVASTRADLIEREKERHLKFALLVNRLQNLADAEGRKTEIKAYGEMEIIVVKSDDPEGINLISEAIDALRTNAVADRANQNLPGTPNPLEKAGGQ